MAFGPFKQKSFQNNQSQGGSDAQDDFDQSLNDHDARIQDFLNQIMNPVPAFAPPPVNDPGNGLGPMVQLSDDGALSPVQSAHHNGGGGGGTGGTTTSTSPSPTSTLAGSATGLQFNLIWDSSVSGAPSAFKSDVVSVAQYYSSLFSNREVINIQVGYGEVGGQSLPSGALAASMSNGYLTNYATIYNGLQKDKSSSTYQATADASLSASVDPTHGGQFFITSAEAKAQGLVSATGTGVDGYIGLGVNNYSFNQSQIGANQFDATGAIEHEISEVMGRIGSVGAEFGSNIYTPLDLFRYSSAGVHDTVAGPGYFSTNGGVTNLGTYNDPTQGGDATDWTSSLVGDSYGFAYLGKPLVVSPTDIVEDAVLGYNMTSTAQTATKTLGLA